PGALFSAAGCTDGVHQYGAAIFFDGVSGGTQVGYWSGTAESSVDMTPPGTFGFSINAVDGSQQVGATAPDPVGNPPIYAAIWNGTAASYVNLHDFVPARYNQSE